MNDSGQRREPEVEFPAFDPGPSLKIAMELLESARASFALAGRLAVWTYVPPAGQQYTKDVDFAVKPEDGPSLREAAAERGYGITDLGIGGIGVKAPGAAIDFIDRHPYFSRLFSDAVNKAIVLSAKIGARSVELPVVPLPHLVAMKMVSGETSDDKDVEELLMTVSADGYGEVRDLVQEHLGRASAERLDVIARRVGHPGPGMKRRSANSDTPPAGPPEGEGGRKDPEEHA